MNSKPQVMITDYVVEPLDYERAELGDRADVLALGVGNSRELVGRLDEAYAVMVYHYTVLDRSLIESMDSCRVIVRPGVGYDNIDIGAAAERGIPVCNVPDYGTEEVADSAIGMALALSRGTSFLNSRLRRGVGEWNVLQGRPIQRIRGRVLGIVGCGRIGTAAVLRAKAFGWDVVFYDPYVSDGIDKALGVRRADSLEELMRQSWIVSLHCLLSEETRGMIGAQEIDWMPEGGFLVNTSRGGVVDAGAVVDALASGKLGGAGIDVLELEPPPDDSPVLRAWRDASHPAHDRLILNPHAAFYCEEGAAEFRSKAAREIRRALDGEPLRNVVNGVDPAGRFLPEKSF